VAIPFPETYNALQTGVIDAQENPLITSILMKFTEVTQYVTRTQHCVTECVIIVSVDYWESLTQAQQQIFKDAARQSIQINRTVTAALHESLPKLNMSVDAYARANNIEIIDLSEQEREMFRKAMTPVWDKYRKKIGNDLFDFVLEKIETHGM
jgi:TRAP-type C4-dicarboxylate transport system substrate-binding protein